MKHIHFVFFLCISLYSCKSDKPMAKKSASTSLPIAHFTFNGGATDLSNHSNNGMVENAISGLDGFSFSSGNFTTDGMTYIRIKDNDLLDIKTNKLSICAWIKPEVTRGSYIIQKEFYVNYQGKLGQGGGPYSLDIFPGYARALLYSNDNNPIILTGTSIIKNNEWQHIALTWDGKMAYLYYNGKVEASGEFDKALLITNGDVYIGTYKWAYPKASFVGSIDNVRIYNDYLSAREIKNIYSNYK
jgi:Concanavalin A-like lectin/glucanases superfamily